MKKEKINKVQLLSILFISGILFTAGDLVAARWVRFGGSYLYAVIFFFYLTGMVLLMKCYKSEDIPVASIITTIFNVLLLIFAGMMFFNEQLSLLKICAIALCIISIFCLEYGKKS